MSPIRLCTGDPRCPNPSVYRGRCQRHARQRERQINRAGSKVYRTARWKHTRNRILADHPLCAQCLREGRDTIATDVHHIRDIADGGDPWAMSNLEPLCKSHHGRITRATQTGATP